MSKQIIQFLLILLLIVVVFMTLTNTSFIELMKYIEAWFNWARIAVPQ